jgi:hypothetical protein
MGALTAALFALENVESAAVQKCLVLFELFALTELVTGHEDVAGTNLRPDGYAFPDVAIKFLIFSSRSL